MQLFLDCDGVLADFDKGAAKIFGMPSKEFEETHGSKRFWKLLLGSGEFFHDLDMMEDAQVLYDAVKHKNPIVLTGIPSDEKAIGQKVRWIRKMFGRYQAIVCCLSRQKYLYCTPGDVLVDDTLKHAQKWIDAGGIFVHHTSAEDSIKQLKELGVL